jgi:hypothetical protein
MHPTIRDVPTTMPAAGDEPFLPEPCITPAMCGSGFFLRVLRCFVFLMRFALQRIALSMHRSFDAWFQHRIDRLPRRFFATQ